MMNSRPTTELQDLAAQAVKAAPAVGGAAVAGLTANEVVALVVGVLTAIYVVLQAAYLVRKWQREESVWSQRKAARGGVPPSTVSPTTHPGEEH